MAEPNSNRGTYVASRTRHAARWRALRALGYRINSSWIDEAGPGQTPNLGLLWERITREVTTSRMVLLYLEPDDFPVKGALVEVGMALGAVVPVRVVMPGVALDDAYRPIGSWIWHPIVSIKDSVEEAMADADACT
jgi:hypothetical protein